MNELMARNPPAFRFLVFLLFTSTTLVFTSSTVVASDPKTSHFRRPDPLRGLRLYRGGYDVRNKHYWASALFKGTCALLGVAGIWTLTGLVFLGFYPVWKKKFTRSSEFRSRCCSLMLVVVVIFLLLMTISSGFTLAESHTLRNRAKMLERSVLGAGGSTCHALQRVLNGMNAIQKLGYSNDQIRALLNSKKMDLTAKLQHIQRVMHTCGSLFNLVLQLTYGVTLGIVILSLVLVSLSIVMFLLHWFPGIIMLLVTCWIVTSICWVVAGFHVFLHIYIDDTCSALNEFEQNPENSSLRSITPCLNATLSDSTMAELGSSIHTFMRQFDANTLNLIRGVGAAAGLSTDFKLVCGPFLSLSKDRYDAIRCLDNVTTEDMLKLLQTVKAFLPQESFKIMTEDASAIEDFIGVFSDMRNLIHCKYLKDAFDDALFKQCKPLRANSKELMSSMISLSVCMVVLVVAYVVKVLGERRLKPMLPAQQI